MLYLYGITDAAGPPDLMGIDGALLRVIGTGTLHAVASEHDDLRLSADEETLWAHEAVVESMMEAGAVLPVRLGSTVDRADSIEDLLRERGSDFTQAIERVRGAVEIGVRGLVATPRAAAGASAAGPGAGYMRDQLARKRRIDAVAGRMDEELTSLVRDATEVTGSHERMSLRAAYLVDRDRVDEFVAAVQRLESKADGVTLVCTGPWPPYSFATGVN
jgi:gas vesicle protein GvpL/GvpF